MERVFGEMLGMHDGIAIIAGNVSVMGLLLLLLIAPPRGLGVGGNEAHVPPVICFTFGSNSAFDPHRAVKHLRYLLRPYLSSKSNHAIFSLVIVLNH
jgi:hypothetical protein